MVGCSERGVKPTPQGPPALRAARHSADAPGYGTGQNRTRNFGLGFGAGRVWSAEQLSLGQLASWALDYRRSGLERAGLNEEQRHRG